MRTTKFHGTLMFMYYLVLVCPKICNSARSENEIREKFYGNLINTSSTDRGDGSIAKTFDRVLEKEFSEISLTAFVLFDWLNWRVAKITHEKIEKNDTNETNKTFQLQDVFSLENEDSEDMATLIDKKEVSIQSSKLIIVVVVTAALGGIIFSWLGQPVGVLLAQVGENAFVLSSRASNLHLIEGKMYLLLLGTTALSLISSLVFLFSPQSHIVSSNIAYALVSIRKWS